MDINDLDSIAEVAESLRDSGWAVVSSSKRLFASRRPGISFSIGRAWKNREDSEMTLTHMEIRVGGVDHDNLSYGIEGTPAEVASFAARVLPIFQEVAEHLSSLGPANPIRIAGMDVHARFKQINVILHVGYDERPPPIKLTISTFQGLIEINVESAAQAIRVIDGVVKR
jgi:hypothetical protein